MRQHDANPRRRVASALVILLLAAATAWAMPAGAHIYRWRDPSGELHFGDNPPPGVSATQIAPTANTVSMGPAPAGAKQGHKRPKGKTAQRPPAARPAAGKEQQHKRCEALRQRLTLLQDHPRLLLHEKNGQTRRLTEGQRQARIKRVRRAIGQGCSGS